MAVVTSVRNFVRSVGSVIGLAVATATIGNTLKDKLASVLSASTTNALLNDPTAIWRPDNVLNLGPGQVALVAEAYIDGFSRFCITLAGLSAASFLACLVLVRKVKLDRADDKALKVEAKRRLQDKKDARKRKTSTTPSLGAAGVASAGSTPGGRASDDGKGTIDDEKGKESQ